MPVISLLLVRDQQGGGGGQQRGYAEKVFTWDMACSVDGTT